MIVKVPPYPPKLVPNPVRSNTLRREQQAAGFHRARCQDKLLGLDLKGLTRRGNDFGAENSITSFRQKKLPHTGMQHHLDALGCE